MAKYSLHCENPYYEFDIPPTDVARFWQELATYNLPKDEIFDVILVKENLQEFHRWIEKGVTIEDVVVVLKEFQRGIYSNATNVKAHTN